MPTTQEQIQNLAYEISQVDRRLQYTERRVRAVRAQDFVNQFKPGDLGEFGDVSTFLDFKEVAVPANPDAGWRRVFANTVTSKLSVRTSAGTTINLEYGDTEAIAAIEGEATLDLTGEITIASGKSLTVKTDGSTGGVKFGSGGDVILYRGAANRLDLGTGDSLRLVSGDVELVTGKVLKVFNAFGDANPLAQYSDDRVEFGAGGASALDSFFRYGTGGFIFGPDNFVSMEETSVGGVNWDITKVGESHARFIHTDSEMAWGDGSATQDVKLFRGAANRLDLASGDSFRIISGQLETDTIAEVTGAAGVTIDSLLIKDGAHGQITGTSDLHTEYVLESLFDATTFLYATNDNTPQPKTPAEVMVILSGASTAAFDLNGQDLTNGGVIFLTEQANAEADVAGKGQFWVKTGAPNTPWFTNENGTDVQLGLGAAHALLDGATHSDTVADAVTRGSFIYGNSTPKWDEFVIGAANTVLASDGTDPSWTGSPALSGTLTVDTINEFTGAAGVTIDGLLIKDEYLEFDEIAAPAAPAANKGRLYVADDGGVTRPYFKDTDGDIAELAGYTLLDSVTLGAAAQTLASFTNIPAKYRNLRVVFHGHSDTNADQLRWVVVQFNGDAGNNYNWQYVADAGGQTALAAAYITVGVINGLLLTYPTWGSIDILGYAGTTLHKGTVSHSGYIAAGDIIDITGAGHWADTSAINRVDILSDNAGTKFETGSVAFLYGY